MSEFIYELLHLYDYQDYQSFEFSPNTFRLVIFFAWIGMIFAIIGSFYSNYYLGRFVNRLIESGADSPENAKSLYELGIDNQPLLERSLREGSVLRRTVLVADIDKDTINMADKNSASNKYYIPTEAQPTAQRRFKTKGNGIVSLVLSIVAITLILLLMLVFGPWLLGIADGLLAALNT